MKKKYGIILCAVLFVMPFIGATINETPFAEHLAIISPALILGFTADFIGIFQWLFATIPILIFGAIGFLIYFISRFQNTMFLKVMLVYYMLYFFSLFIFTLSFELFPKPVFAITPILFSLSCIGWIILCCLGVLRLDTTKGS
jgi:hypothetical protein